MKNENDVAVSLLIKYDGHQASEGSMPLDDFIVSLQGWNNFLTASSYAFRAQKLTLLEKPAKEKIELNIREVRQGSLEAYLYLFGIAAAGTFLGNKADKVVTTENCKKCMTWVKNLFASYIEQKKGFKTQHESAEAIKIVAGEAGIVTDNTFDESHRFIGYIDESLKKATFPINISAKTINLVNSEINLFVDLQTRRAIISDFLPDRKADTFFKALVRVRELNLDTGHTRLEVFETENDSFRSRIGKCYIVDNVLRDAGNVYSKSLDMHVSIQVYVGQVLDKGTGRTERWEIAINPPKYDAPLFE